MCLDQLRQDGKFPIRTYIYRCKSCGVVFETNFTTETECLTCQSYEIVRVYTAPTVVFKGHGFYKTDNSTKKE